MDSSECLKRSGNDEYLLWLVGKWKEFDAKNKVPSLMEWIAEIEVEYPDK